MNSPNQNPENGRVRGDGVELAYRLWPGKGQPIVAIHGLTAQNMNMVGFAERLEGRRPVFAIDLRGRGDSDKPAGPYGMAQHARDVAAAMRSKGLARSLVLGHSMGAYVATALAAQNPELVQGLVLLDGGYVPDPPPGVELKGLLDLLLAPMLGRLQMRFKDLEEYRAYWKTLPYFAPEDWNPWIEAYVQYDLGGAAPFFQPKAREEGVRTDFLDMANRDAVEGCLKRVKAPLLLVRAEHGVARGQPPVVPDSVVAAIRRCVPHAREERIPGTTHYTIALGQLGATRTVELLLSVAEHAGC